MKKHLIIMLIIGQVALLPTTYSQNIAINGNGALPDTSAMLDVSSTIKGFLAPRMTTAQQNSIPLPANGLLIYNTTDNAFKVNTGTTLSPVWVALSTGSGSISSINGLTAASQTFTTGTAGSDFGIGSAVNTHTFNLPTASAANRGALSAADWVAFNAKQGALVSGTTIKTINSTSLLGSGNITAEPVITAPNSAKTYLNGYKQFVSFLTDSITEGSNNLYFTSTRARAAITLTTTGTSGTATYNSSTGALNIPAYPSNTGTVTSVSALTLSAAGTDLSSTVATGTTTPVITLNVPTASAANRGALSAADWSTFNGKQMALVSGTTIKTINSISLLGSGNMTVEPVITAPNLIKTYLNGYKQFVSFLTDSITEGSANLYFTNARARTAITLTTTGTSGAATYNSSTGALNIPAYTSNAGTVTSVSALTLSATGTDLSSTIATGTTTPVITLNVPTASAANRGALSAADWSTFNGKQAALLSGTTIKTINNTSLLGSGNIPVEPVISAPNSIKTYLNGYKQFVSLLTDSITEGTNNLYFTNARARASITLTTTGTSGAATYNSATGALNIPAYSSGVWLLGGNSGITQPATPATYGTSVLGSSENFLGTEDAKDLVFATNNRERMRILNTNGYLGIGTSTPTKPIELVSSLANVGLVKLQNTDLTGYSSIDIWSNTTQIGNIGFSNSGAAYPNAFYFATNTTNSMVFATNNTERMRIDGSTGNMGVGVTLPTAQIHIDAGSASAGSAPLKFTSGTNLATVENGAMEFDGTNYFATSGGTRYTLAKTLTNTATLDFPSTGKQASSDLTITVTGAQTGDVVSVGVPVSAIVTSSTFTAYVSAINTVTVRYNNNGNSTYDPASGVFRVAVLRY